MLFALSINAQTKKPGSKEKFAAKDSSASTLKGDTISPLEAELKAERKFGAYTRKPKKSDNRMKLCLNLVSAESMLELCVPDSACKYPEKYKILFEKKDMDTTYVLVFVEAFSKLEERSSCDAGKETKLFYVRWNTKTNRATWKQRTVSSCIKGVTNMTREPITNWDGISALTLNYYRGGTNFIELKFDPKNYLLGFQSSGDSEAK